MRQAQRPDVFIFPATLAGDELAAYTHATQESIGKVVVDTHDNLHGYLVRVITSHGKRPGEGQIAASMKSLERAEKIAEKIVTATNMLTISIGVLTGYVVLQK